MNLENIEAKLKKAKQLFDKLQKINSMLSENHSVLTKEDLELLSTEKNEIEKLISKNTTNIKEKYSNFIYSLEDIKNAPKINWLVEDIIPSQSIGVFYGQSGSGKTTTIINMCKYILKNHTNAYIVYIDADMSINKIKQLGVDRIIEKYKERFLYAGKSTSNVIDLTQNLLSDIVYQQKENKDKKFIVIEDSLSLTARKKRGFIDTEQLYKHEKNLRAYGGTSIIIHHTNKNGVFADSQHIENFADYTYLIERNDFNSCILLHPQKASRYEIKGKAFLTKDREIVEEVDYETSNISVAETMFVNYVSAALEDGEMNQSELIKHLEKIRFFTEYKIGIKKAITWLKKWSNKSKWSYERRADKKNAIFYYKSEKLAKLQNCVNKEV